MSDKHRRWPFPQTFTTKPTLQNHTESFSTKAVISNYFQSFIKEENWETEIVGATYDTGRKGHWTIMWHLRTQEARRQVRTITLSVVGCKVLVSSLHQSLVWLGGVGICHGKNERRQFQPGKKIPLSFQWTWGPEPMDSGWWVITLKNISQQATGFGFLLVCICSLTGAEQDSPTKKRVKSLKLHWSFLVSLFGRGNLRIYTSASLPSFDKNWLSYLCIFIYLPVK